jgi:hypothetical protein
MNAVTWQGRRDIRVVDVPDPVTEMPTDAIVGLTLRKTADGMVKVVFAT